MWSQPCAHVIFDTDPAPRGGHAAAKPEEMCQAMIRFAKLRRIVLVLLLKKKLKLFNVDTRMATSYSVRG